MKTSVGFKLASLEKKARTLTTRPHHHRGLYSHHCMASYFSDQRCRHLSGHVQDHRRVRAGPPLHLPVHRRGKL